MINVFRYLDICEICLFSGTERFNKLELLKYNHKDNLQQPTARKTITQASYAVAWEIARAQKPFSDGEFVKTCLTTVAKLMFPNKVKEIENIKLSRQTVSRRVEHIAQYIRKTIDEKITNFVAYSVALDETTDIEDTPQLALFIRGVDKNLCVQEYLLDLIALKERTTGEDIFIAFRNVIESKKLPWSKLVSVATDGAPSMCGEKKGFIGRLRAYLKEMGKTDKLHCFHCIIHQEALSAKLVNLEHVMNVVVNLVNKIRSKALNHRKFRNLLENLHENDTDLLYYTEVRWLSRGRMIKRFFNLRHTVEAFMKLQVRIFVLQLTVKLKSYVIINYLF